MKLQRILVTLGAVGFAGFGLYGLFSPLGIFGLVHGTASHVDTLNDLRAVYGGFQLGIACFLAACLADRWSLSAGLFLMTATFACMVVARTLSFVVDGAPTPALMGGWAFEAVMTCVGAYGLAAAKER